MPKFSWILSFFFFFSFFFILFIAATPLKAVAVDKVKVGVLVRNSSVAQRCISMAFSDFYEAHPHYRTRLALRFRDPNDGVVTAASAAMELMENEQVHAVIGPEYSTQAKFIIDLGFEVRVPIISFSATSPSLSPMQHNSYFIRTADDDRSQLRAIASIIQTYGWTQVVVIYEDTDYGNGLFPHISDVFQEHDIQVPYRSEIPPCSGDDDILEELNKVMKNTRARVFLVHMTASLGSRVFTIANEAGMLSQETAWIVTDGLSSLLDPDNIKGIDAMQGVLGVRPYIPMSEQLKRFQERWKSNQLGHFSKDWNLFGLWAYDTVTALAMVAEKIWNSSESHYFRNEPNNKTSSMDYSAIGISRIGPKLLERMRDIELDGLSGDFHLLNGQLRASTIFEIFNVVGKQERVIGYWTPRNGISRSLLDQRDDLKPPIWPGDTVKNPRGWIATVGGKKLRIGVPDQKDTYSFKELIKVERVDHGNYSFSGFSCDVFIAVLKQLPYDIPLELIPYRVLSTPNATYDNMIFQIKLKNYDAVIGDTSITPSRLDYVGFTIPYTEAGVSMLVKAKEVDERKSMWVFLKPLSWDMWFTTAMAFLMIGFIVWVFERHHNEDFSGSPGHQVVVSLWFSFSTLVFAQRERVLNKWTRLVLVIWVFVVLIITQTYTASLASFLTVQQLQPRTLEVAELVRTGQYIGFQSGSYVKDLLLRLNFEESRLIGLDNPEEYHDALSKGSKNGGVAAVFDEIPYLRIVVGKYCNTYMIVGPVYQTDGFAFAFPLGSPLIPDFSRAIVNLKSEGKISEIGRKYFGNETCEAAKFSVLDESILNVYSFGGLFIIVGVVSVAAILGESLSSSSLRHDQLAVCFSKLRAALVISLNQVVVHLCAWWQWRMARTENNVVAMASST